MPAPHSDPRKIEPELLGPLGPRPLAETATPQGPGDLFPGSSTFLRARQVERRRTQWTAVRQLIDRLLAPGERVVYVAHAQQVPTLFQSLSMGHMVHAYHQVLLVITDARLYEILLNLRATRPETRIRSFPWRHVRALNMRFGKLQLTPAEGRKQAWRLRVRGDKKLVALLLPRIQPRLLGESTAGAGGAAPLWHCPECGVESAARPEHCASCGAQFRSPRLAACLSLAFPGAGLWYAGHPGLACLDFLGEAALFAVVAVGLATAAQASEVAGLVVLGLVLLTLTKLESVHLGHILVTRTRPESARRQAAFRRFTAVGGAVSLLAVTGAVLAAGSFKPVVDHDLAVQRAAERWTYSTNATEWEFFSEDPAARAQWTHESGLVLTLFAYPVGSALERARFQADFTATMEDGNRLLLTDDRLPGGFRGFRHISETVDANGEPVSSIHYFVNDEEGRDIHQVFVAVPSELRDSATQAVEEFLSTAEWSQPVAPTR